MKAQDNSTMQLSASKIAPFNSACRRKAAHHFVNPMDHSFWLQRWRDNMIGFHRDEVNRHLQQIWPEFGVAEGASVFVPMCGKSVDMLWLARRHPVLGVELSPRAVTDFFAENNLVGERQQACGFQVTRGDNITLYCGDYFDLTPDTTQAIAAVYDRASLIAVPPAMQALYVEKLASLTPEHVPVLLVSLVYPQQQMDGPPFSVDADDVQRLFSAGWRIEPLLQQDILDAEPHFRKRGLTSLEEHVYRLEKR